ncbi:hypothetical protein RIF29_40876 [Crotalaria pallida]|uniref:Uncharacterized protein n=1 Tax=Crotalaria pallida TaxID=3830 RepID=A0AAN9E407_CROPI
MLFLLKEGFGFSKPTIWRQESELIVWVYFASLKGQCEIVVHHYIQQGEAKKALEVLQKPSVPYDLQ